MPRFLTALLGSLLACLAPAAHAACSHVPLASGTTVATADSLSPFVFNQTSAYWSAVALRPDPGGDWNLTVHQTPGDPPSCVSTLLGSSARTDGVDLVVGDFNAGHNALANYYPLATRVTGTSGAVVEWDDGSNSLVVGGPLVNRTTDVTDVIEAWDVYLVSGRTYSFIFQPEGAALSLLLFRSEAGPYWASRDSALLEVTSGTEYAPSQTGYYGVVVVNDDGAAGSYALGVGTCTGVIELASGVSVSTAGFAERHYRLDQNHVFWTAVGVRGTSNWNVGLYGSQGGTSYPTCLSDPLVTSSLPAPTVDFVAGNFNRMLVGSFFARVFLDQDQGAGSALVEWDDDADVVVVDGDAIEDATEPSDVLSVRDIYLTAGLTYQFRFSTTGADLRMLLLPPSESWTGRSAALFERTGDPDWVPYEATQTGWHGLVVVNEDGGTGSYTLSVHQGPLDAGVRAPLSTALQGVFPNPASGEAHIDFTLAETASISFEVLDLSGRRVLRNGPSTWAPGRWTIPWAGTARIRRNLSPGVYFLRMSVGDRVVGRRKFVLLD